MNDPVDEFQYNCNTCRDHHWVIFEDEVYDCPKCGVEYRMKYLWEYSGIPEKDRHKTLDAFEVKTEKQKVAFKAIQDIIADVSQVDLVLLYGPTGTGKSHLGIASVIHWIQKGRPARVVRCNEWLDRLRASFNNSGETTENLKKELYSTHYLVLDELSCETPFEWRTMDEVISRRYERHYPTIVTTNKDMLELREYLPRIVSRAKDVIQGRKVLLEGEDYREKGRN